jgi:uncharacterized membrane protein
MPGFLPHFIVGNILFFFGWQYIKTFLKKDFTRREYLLLYVVCIFGSIIPDFPLGLYYLFNISTFDSLLRYHIFLHLIISPLAVGFFIILNVIGNVRKKPIWIFGVLSVIIHVLMDATIEEMGVWI